MGFDLVENYNHATSDNKKQIDLVKDYIEMWTEEVMSNNKDFSELIIFTIRITDFLEIHMQGDNWTVKDSRSQERVHQLLLKYDNTIGKTIDPEMYKQLVERWMKKSN